MCDGRHVLASPNRDTVGVNIGASGSVMRLEIVLGEDGDARDLDAAAAQLRSELLLLDVDSVRREPGEPAPPGTRAIEAAVLGSLLVDLGQGTVGAILAAIRGWLRRATAPRVVKVTLGGETLELSNASAADQQRLVEAFLARQREEPA